VSLSLVMTTCATFIVTKANAATVTFTMEGGEKPKIAGEWVTFIVSLEPDNNVQTWFEDFIGYDFDQEELSDGKKFIPFVSSGDEIKKSTVIGSYTFNVLKGVKKGGGTDFWSGVKYSEKIGNAKNTHEVWSKTIIDVVPPEAEPPKPPEENTPEPLTMLGAVAALGYGVILKRSSSKMKKS
jgi:hypothetical protein